MKDGRKKADCFTKAALKERGWTDGMIRKRLGEPDRTAQNPFYKSAAPMRLYLKSRVQAAESADGFAADKERGALRSARGRAAAETRVDAAVKWAMELPIEIPTMSAGEAMRRGYEARQEFLNVMSLDSSSPPPTLGRFQDVPLDVRRRWAVNYIRHECTGYDAMLYQMYGRVGVSEAHDVLKDRIDEAVRDMLGFPPD